MFDKLNAYLQQKGMTIDTARIASRQTIMEYLQQARIDNQAFLDIAAPTAADRNTQVTKLTRQMIRIERLLVNDLTGTNGVERTIK